MSGAEIVGVAAAAFQFAQFVGRLGELHSKLRTFQSALESLSEAAQTIESSTRRTKNESNALRRMKQGLEDSYHTLFALFRCWGKLRKRGTRSSLRLVVDYWFYENEGKEVVSRGVDEIVDRVKSIESALLSINTHVAYDSREVIFAIHERRPSSTPSTYSTSFEDDDTMTMCEIGEVKWNLELLIDEESDSDTSGLSGAIITAIENKESRVVAQLLANGEDPLAKDDNGWCAFHYAVRADSKKVMRELLRSKKVQRDIEGVDRRNKSGATPLHFASSIGRKSMARELLNAKADKNAVDNHNRSPLFVAVEGKHIGIVELLLDEGAKFEPSTPVRFKQMRNTINNNKSIMAKAQKV
ncbi:uncharacterized protein BP5553_01256 [Venustampulla echinocandica]|uniref:Uncharacterized protein n=1 Tax=Venustampulla echinocandica TaxID=2656787 RepID=A0A370U0H9_9HELO|nr:uncharacterized protein BP5553_01256 [Venustampulla echinocandica]RDL41277.1 hypothetical protein BP5553_01256 [Venustampulla echinocandica]